MKIFDVSSKTLLRTLRGHDNATHVCEFLTTQNLASFSDDKTVRLWDVSTEDEIQKFNEHKVIDLFSDFYNCKSIFLF